MQSLKLTRLRFTPLIVIIAISLWSSTVFSQSYTLGYARYTRGDFQGAIEAFELSLRGRSSSVDEKAKLFKYLGISWYMLGEKRKAAGHFQSALRLQSQLEILKEEVLDESVIELFDAIKKRHEKKRKSMERRSLVLPTEPTIVKKQLPIAEKTVSEPTQPEKHAVWPRYLPFGIGLLSEGRYLAGSVFGISQLSMLGLYYQSTLDEEQLSQDANYLIQDALNNSRPIEEIENFRLEANRLIEDEKKMQNAYLAGFAGLWLSSIVYSWLTEDSSPSKLTQSDSWQLQLGQGSRVVYVSFRSDF